MISRVLKLLLVLALIFLMGWVLYRSSTIIVYILIAGVITLIGSPMVKGLNSIVIRGRRMPNGLSAAITLLFLFGIFGMLLSLFLPLIFEEARVLTTIDLDQVEKTLAPVMHSINGFIARIDPAHSAVHESELIRSAFDSLDFSALPGVLNSLVAVFGNVVVAVFSVAFISFFFLSDRDMVPRLVMLLTPKTQEPRALSIMRNTRKTLSRYFLGLMVQVIAVSTLIFIGLSIIGVKNALLIAIFTGIVNLVPYLGPWIGASFGAFILVANNIDASFMEVIRPKLIALVIVFVATQLIDNYVFQPTIFSSSINAHPLEIFLVILVAGTLAGVGGMIAAIPVYSFLRIAFVEMDREFGWMRRLKAK